VRLSPNSLLMLNGLCTARVRRHGNAQQEEQLDTDFNMDGSVSFDLPNVDDLEVAAAAAAAALDVLAPGDGGSSREEASDESSSSGEDEDEESSSSEDEEEGEVRGFLHTWVMYCVPHGQGRSHAGARARMPHQECTLLAKEGGRCCLQGKFSLRCVANSDPPC